jgi:hypothetical protein
VHIPPFFFFVCTPLSSYVRYPADANIYGKKFFQITLSDLVETLPRPITTYADRRRLLNEIRAIGRPADIGPKQRIRDPVSYYFSIFIFASIVLD